MIRLWLAQAGRYNVLPLDDRGIELFVQRRPDADVERDLIRFLPGGTHIDRFSVPDIRNRSHSLEAQISRAAATDNGTIVACGSRTGGYALYVHENRLVYAYNHVGDVTTVTAETELPLGQCIVRAVFTKTGEHQGELELQVNDQAVGGTSIRLLPWRQTLFGMDIGLDAGSSVTPSYEAPNRFAGTIAYVDYQLGHDRDDLVRAARIEGRNALTDQ